MFARQKQLWDELRRLPPGCRFEMHHRREHEGDAKTSSLRSALHWTGAVTAFGVGVVLVFIPGPAVVFFALSGVLAATQSLWVARGLDWTELKVRAAARAAHRVFKRASR